MKTKKNYLTLLFIGIISVIVVVAFLGFIVINEKTEMIQGEVEVAEYRVSSKVPGRLLELRVKEGDLVKKGDTLAVLDAPEIIAKHQQAEAAKAAAQAQNEKAIKGVRAERIQMAFEMWQKSKAAVEVMEKSYKRMKNLNEEGVVPNQKLDEIKAKRDAAVATEKAAHAQYDMAKNGAEREDKMAALALVNRAKGAVEEVEAYLHETYLIAAEDGEVSEIFPEIGELLGAGGPIMNVAMNTDKWVLFNVREDLLNDLKKGNEFEAFVPALNNEKIKLKVTYLKDLGSYATWKATKTRGDFDLKTFEVKAIPLTKNSNLRSGMSVIYEKVIK